MANQDTRKQLIISRHIAKMSPEEIARRFVTTYVASVKPKSSVDWQKGGS